MLGLDLGLENIRKMQNLISNRGARYNRFSQKVQRGGGEAGRVDDGRSTHEFIDEKEHEISIDLTAWRRLSLRF